MKKVLAIVIFLFIMKGAQMSWVWWNKPSVETSTSEGPSAWKAFWSQFGDIEESHPQDELRDFLKSDREKSFVDEFKTGIWQYQFPKSKGYDLKLIESKANQVVLRKRYLYTNSESRRTTWNERVFTITQTSPTTATMTMEIFSLGNMATPNPDKSYSFRKLLNSYSGDGQRGVSSEENLLTWRFSYKHKKSGSFGRANGAAENSGFFDLKQTSQLSYIGL